MKYGCLILCKFVNGRTYNDWYIFVVVADAIAAKDSMLLTECLKWQWFLYVFKLVYGQREGMHSKTV